MWTYKNEILSTVNVECCSFSIDKYLLVKINGRDSNRALVSTALKDAADTITTSTLER